MKESVSKPFVLCYSL